MLIFTKIRPLEFVIFHTDRQTDLTKLVVDFRHVHKIAKSDYYIHHVRLSVFPQGTTGRIFMKFDIWIFLENFSRKFKFLLISSQNNECLHENLGTFIILPRRIFRMRNVSDKSCRGSTNTHFIFNNVFRTSCRLWGNVLKYCKAGQATDDNMAQAHCMLDT